jgi:uncharacterized membrane protein SpoIIM required for sporulation
LREAAFIKQNKEKWLEFERALYHTSSIKPERLAELFIQVNNDLAYAQTYYPKSNVIKYLNAITTTAYHKIYGHKQKKGGLADFWTHEIPMIMYQYRKYFYFSFFIFFLMVLIGVFSAIHEPEFVRSILGDEYVEMTERNVENGDPLAVYNNSGNLDNFNSFFLIAFNNLRVGLMSFIYGIFGGIGSLYFMLVNGVMVGSFQYMFYEKGHFFLSLRTIWMHGSMEIFAMCIEIGAGILMGTSYLFPGVLTRKQAFFQKGKAALKIVMSTIPFTIFAALIEGYITQFANELPIFIAALIVLSTLGFIVWYYLIYPVWVFKKSEKGKAYLLKEVGNEKI